MKRLLSIIVLIQYFMIQCVNTFSNYTDFEEILFDPYLLNESEQKEHNFYIKQTLKQRRNLEVEQTEKDGENYQIKHIYIPCTNYLNLHPQIQKTFDMTGNYPEFSLTGSDEPFCTVDLIDIHIIVTETQQNCDLQRFYVRLSCPSKQNINVSNLVINQDSLQEFVIPDGENQDGELDGEDGEQYFILQENDILENNSIKPTFKDIQFYISSQNQGLVKNLKFQEYSVNNFVYFRSFEDVIIQNCSFNTSDHLTAFLYLYSFNKIQIIECDFYEPQDYEVISSFTGYFVYGYYVDVFNTTFTNNRSNRSGSAIYLLNVDYIQMIDSTFSGHTSTFSSAIIIVRPLTTFVKRCNFTENVVDGDAAAIKWVDPSDFIEVIECQFYDNKAFGSYGGTLYTNSGPTYINILDNIFENNQGWNAGIAFLNDTQTLLVDNCTFIHNEGQIGGVFLLEKVVNITMQNLIMNDNFCNNLQTQTGEVGAILIDNNELVNAQKNNILLQNITFNGNSAHDSAAVEIRNIIDGESLILQDLVFNNNKVLSLSAGAIKLDNVRIPQTIQNIQMLNNTAYLNGGCIFLEDVFNSTITNITMVNSFAGFNGGSIYLAGKNQDINIYNLTIQNSGCNVKGGAISIVSGQRMNFYDININGGQSNTGSVSITQSEDIIFNNILIKDTDNFQVGGIQVWESQNINIKNITVINCKASDSYGGIDIYKSEQISLLDIIIQNNTAGLLAGGLSILNSQNNNFQNIKIFNNSANDNGGGVTIQNSDNQIFLNIKVENNFAQRSGGGLELKYATNIQFQDMQVNNNIAQLKTGGAFSLDSCSQIIFTNITSNNNQGMTGGAFYLISQTDIKFNNIQINNNLAGTVGGGLYIIESTIIKVQQMNVSNNKAIQTGGGLTIMNSKDLKFQDFKINYNIAQDNNGGGLFIYDRGEDIFFVDGEISYNQADQQGGAIWIDHIVQLQLQNVHLKSNNALEKGGSIYLSYSELLQIKKCIFEHNTNPIEEGSNIFIDNLLEIQIEKCNFSNNQATLYGGSIKLLDTYTINIKESQFYNNKVIEQDMSMGGTIFIKRANQLNFSYNNITNSYADKYGGGIYLENILITNINNNTFQNNTVNFDQNLDINNKLSTYKLTQGGAIYYEIKNLFKEKETDLIIIDMIQNSFDQSQASSGGSIMFNFNFGNFVKYLVQENIFSHNIADIGPSIRYLGVDKQDSLRRLNEVSNIFNNNKGLLVEDDIYYGYYTNEKLINEEYTQFELCEQGQNLKEGGKLLCDQCNVNGVCEGGYHKMYPKPEYWRFSIEDEEFYYCSNNPSVCLGEDKCKEGHLGLLCEKCDLLNNYSASGDDCKLCAPQFNLWINICLLFLLTCFLLGNQIYGLSSRIKKKLLQKSISNIYDLCFQKVGQLSGVTKILLMHFQILYLVATYNIEFPYEVTSSIQIIGNQQKMFSNSLNCMMKAENNEDVKMMEYYLAYYGLGLTIGTLLILIIFELLIYLQNKFIKQKEQLYGYFKGSVVCFFLMVQPGLLQNSLAFVVCRDVGGQSFNMADSNIKCNEDLFTKEILPVNLFVIILIGFLIPIALGIALLKYKRKNVLWRVNVQRSVGILYLEVKDKFYYWEIITIIIKILIVIISIAFQSQVVIKGCLCTIILIVYLVVCYKLKPFATLKLNNLSVFATMTQTLSIILVMCLYELEEKQINNWETISWIPIIIMITLNVVFISFIGYLILHEFEWMFRYMYLSYIKVDSKIKKVIQKRIEREKKAKSLWRLIKIGIHHSTVAKRRIKKENKEICINKEEIFYLYVQNAINNSIFIKYQDKINLDQQLQFMPSSEQNEQQPVFPTLKISTQMKKYPLNYHKQSLGQSKLTADNEIQDTKASPYISQPSISSKMQQDIQFKKYSQDTNTENYSNNQQLPNQQINNNNIQSVNLNLSKDKKDINNLMQIADISNLYLNNDSKIEDYSQNISRQEFLGSNRSYFTNRENIKNSINHGDFHDNIVFEEKSEFQLEETENNENKQKQDSQLNIKNQVKQVYKQELIDSQLQNQEQKENLNQSQDQEMQIQKEQEQKQEKQLQQEQNQQEKEQDNIKDQKE